MNLQKVVVIGAGNVGSATAFRLMNSGLFNKIAIIDANQEKAEGEALDIAHGSVLATKPVKVYAGSYEKDVKDAGFVVITAGAAQKPGETRLDLVKKNTSIFKSIVPAIMETGFSGYIVVVANPVDILTYVTYKLSGLPKERIIGSGTVLDSSRFIYLLSQELKVNAASISADILGEHGDSSFPAWSRVTVHGTPVDEFAKARGIDLTDELKENIYQQVRDSAYEIINKKGTTNYGIAMTTTRIVEGIYTNSNKVMPVSSVMDGEYGLEGLAISMPALISREGVVSLELSYTAEELSKLRASAETMKSILDELDLD